jgi:hypothetical protein
VLQLLADGNDDVEQIKAITGSNVKSIQTWKSDFEKGKKSKSAKRFFGKKDFSSADFSECVGYASTLK